MTDKQEKALVVLNKVASNMSKKAGFLDDVKAGLGKGVDATKAYLANPENRKELLGYAGSGLAGAAGAALLGRKNPIRNSILGFLLGTGAYGAGRYAWDRLNRDRYAGEMHDRTRAEGEAALKGSDME